MSLLIVSSNAAGIWIVTLFFAVSAIGKAVSSCKNVRFVQKKPPTLLLAIEILFVFFEFFRSLQIVRAACSCRAYTCSYFMKSISLYILLLLLSFDNVKTQTYSSIISDDEIYDFVNSIIVSNKNKFDWGLLKKINLNPNIEDGWDSLNFIRPNIGYDTMRFIIKSGIDEIEYFFLYLGIFLRWSSAGAGGC